MRTYVSPAAALCCLVLLAGPAGAADLRLGLPFPEGILQWKIAEKATVRIAEATGGRAKPVLSSFRPDQENLAEKISGGELDGGLVMGDRLADVHRDALAYAVPFTFRSYEQVDSVRQSLDAVILQKLSAGPYEALGIVEGGLAYIMSTQAVDSPDELRKRKIWVPAEGELTRCLRRMGLTPVVQPLKGLRGRLGKGTVDTVIAPPVLTVGRRWHSKTRKILDAPFVYTYGMWIVRDDALQKLSAEDRKAVREGLSDSCKELSTSSRKDNDRCREVLVKYRCEFAAPDAAMKKQWTKWAEEVWQHLGERHKPTAEVEGKLRQHIRAFDEAKN